MFTDAAESFSQTGRPEKLIRTPRGTAPRGTTPGGHESSWLLDKPSPEEEPLPRVDRQRIHFISQRLSEIHYCPLAKFQGSTLEGKRRIKRELYRKVKRDLTALLRLYLLDRGVHVTEELLSQFWPWEAEWARKREEAGN